MKESSRVYIKLLTHNFFLFLFCFVAGGGGVGMGDGGGIGPWKCVVFGLF